MRSAPRSPKWGSPTSRPICLRSAWPRRCWYLPHQESRRDRVSGSGHHRRISQPEVSERAHEMQSKLRRRMAPSPLARGAAVPLRTMIVARYDAQLIGRSIDWLVRSRETHNFTYDLTSLNRDQLCWFVAAVSGAKIALVRAWIQELEEDDDLRQHLTRRMSSNPRRG